MQVPSQRARIRTRLQRQPSHKGVRCHLLHNRLSNQNDSQDHNQDLNQRNRHRNQHRN